MPMSVASLMAAAGQNPTLEGILIVLATFILEDAATVLAAIRAQSGDVPIPVALAALYIGIVLGDLGLYALGRLATRVRWAARLLPQDRVRQGSDWLEGRVFTVVLISRFIPGARLPTYTACGYLRGNLTQFALAAVVATSIWTSLLFAVSYELGSVLMTYLGAWRWLGAAGFAATIFLIGRAASRMAVAR